MLRTSVVLLYTAVVALAGFLVMIPVTWILGDVRPMYAVAQAVVRSLLKLAGVEVEVGGADLRLLPRPCIYVANHVSNVDPPVLFGYLPRVAIMAKAAVFRIPVLGYALKLGGFIPVERERRDSRRQALEAGMDRLRQGLSLLVFPEGTRSPDGALLPFRPGPFTMAIETQVPIVPITIVGTREVMPKGRSTIRPGRAKIIIHQPVPTTGLDASGRSELIERVRSIIAAALPADAVRAH
ncbi:MAG TPA: lysophospholipid acyltransferase family protein [Bryobacterales bacterium]|jgi:1-acyl-sn-glycerol-3-phosphate acyltransferase|nr:lysophospholipid acyltransferase family protein [Bryobacterales bacterium]